LAAQGVSSSVIRIVDFSSLTNSNGTEPDFNSLVLTSNATTDQIITLDVGGSANNEVFALLLNKLNPDNSLELKGIESAILIGSGTVFVGDNNDVNLQGDAADQHITGSGGNDTLVGGGGNDTLIGGAGTDIIGFTELGHYTVEIDLNDKLAFQIDNVTSIDDLVAVLTDVTESNGNVTYEFLDGHASITLVGVTASEVTENLVQFHL
jgi:Ca2+-binding RTX toxin-like protein